MGARTDAEPTVIGEIEHPARALASRHGGAWKDDLVTDQWCEAWSPWRGEHALAVAGNESSGHLGELHEAKPLHEVLEGQVFAKWNEMHLVVDRQHRAVLVDDVDRIIGAI